MKSSQAIPSIKSAPEASNASNFRLLFDLCPDALLVIHTNLRVCFGNEAAERLCPIVREPAGGSLADWVNPSDREALFTFIAQTQRETDGTSLGRQFRFFSQAGDLKTIELRARNLPSHGDRRQILLSCHDVSGQKEKLEQAAEMAFVDSLTGLFNLRRFEEALDREMHLSRRTARPFSILLLDLDHLKQINDTTGHLAGNRAICRVARALRDQCRATDIAGRFGGDEFYLILPESNVTEALFCADRIRGTLAHDGESPALSVSIGVASFPQDGETLETLTQAADAELYRAKRNRKPLPGAPERTNKVSRMNWLTPTATAIVPAAT